MAANKAKGTKCELLLRRNLWRLGFRYRKNVLNLPGKPDIVFTRPRVAIFCDGDFWHGKEWEKRKQKLSKGYNASYWLNKIKSNMERDRLHTMKLEAEGWHVIRLWESDIIKDPIKAAQIVVDAVRASSNSVLRDSCFQPKVV